MIAGPGWISRQCDSAATWWVGQEYQNRATYFSAITGEQKGYQGPQHPAELSSGRWWGGEGQVTFFFTFLTVQFVSAFVDVSSINNNNKTVYFWIIFVMPILVKLRAK